MRHPWLWVRAYAVVSGIVAIIFVAAILIGPYRAIERSDYVTYQTAAHIVLEARGDCLYTLACQSRVQRDLIGEEPSFNNGALPFNSPPWLAALLAPLGTLPLRLAFALFTLLSVVVLGFAAWRLAWGGFATRAVAVILVLGAWPTAMAVIRGQSTLGVAGLLGLSVAGTLAGRRTRSGVLLGLAVLKPTLPPIWSASLLAQRQWRTVAAAAGVAAALVVLAAVAVSPTAVADYPAFLLNLAGADTAPGVHVEQMMNWRGAAFRLGIEGGPLVMLGVIGTLLIVLAAWWWTRRSPRAAALGAAVSLVATPLVLPHANQHEAILPILGILVAAAAFPDARRWLVVGAVVLHLALWTGPLLSGSDAGWLLFAASLTCLIAMVALAWRERTRYFRPVPVPPGTV